MLQNLSSAAVVIGALRVNALKPCVILKFESFVRADKPGSVGLRYRAILIAKWQVKNAVL